MQLGRTSLHTRAIGALAARAESNTVRPCSIIYYCEDRQLSVHVILYQFSYKNEKKRFPYYLQIYHFYFSNNSTF